MKTLRTWVAAATMLSLSSAAYAASVFQGRLADGTASATCTVSGAAKCAMFYNTTLDITILNDWNIGAGFYSASADAGSAQALAELAGAAQTNFTGWFLPTGNGDIGAGALNQYLSILNDVGGSIADLGTQFDRVVEFFGYWSGSEVAPNSVAWALRSTGTQIGELQSDVFLAAAVRPGDVTASVPEPQTLALALMALGATLVARRRRVR